MLQRRQRGENITRGKMRHMLFLGNRRKENVRSIQLTLFGFMVLAQYAIFVIDLYRRPGIARFNMYACYFKLYI